MAMDGSTWPVICPSPTVSAYEPCSSMDPMKMTISPLRFEIALPSICRLVNQYPFLRKNPVLKVHLCKTSKCLMFFIGLSCGFYEKLRFLMSKYFLAFKNVFHMSAYFIALWIGQIPISLKF